MLLLFKMNVIIFITSLMMFLAVSWVQAQEEEISPRAGESLEESLEKEVDFFATEVETASARGETLRDAPATMMVVTAEEIKQRGYTDLTEVIKDLPGFDVVISNGTAYMTAYQRGYRTLYTSRTSFMINGVVDNMLWSNEAAMSRQYPLSNIKRIEVLYGPASAVYGPNAFLGIINIITYDGGYVKEGTVEGRVNLLGGSYKSRGIDATVRGKPNKDLSFSITGKLFQSDEPDFTDDFEFLKQEQFSSRDYWGPLLGIEHEGHQLGSYYDPTDDYGILADLHYKDIKFGLIHWKRKEAYGPYYVADRVQNNAFWNKDSTQYFVEYDRDWTARLKSSSLLLYRNSRRYGYWAEGDPIGENASSISFTHWNSMNKSWLFKQNFEFALRENFLLSGGFKFERKELTKAYDIPGYWGAPSISSSAPEQEAIGHSTDSSYTLVPPIFSEMPSDNLERTRDIGWYFQGIYDLNRFRFNGGVRYDKNSVYGEVINPRLSLLYKASKPLTFKFLFGKAFQEPPPILLWGGWSGREANPDLEPEKAQNVEFIGMYQTKRFFQEGSLYWSHYTNVIREGFEQGKPKNFGDRDVVGFEYRGKYSLPNFIANSDDITGYFNYTWTHLISDAYYDPNTGEWFDQNGDGRLEDGMGDIAPHKFNIGMNMPIGQRWNLNLRGNFVGERELDPRNKLRVQRPGEKLDSYFTLDGVLAYRPYKLFDVSVKVLNILDQDYFHPGVEGANSGRDATSRSLGYMNSLIPQPGRSWWINLGINF